MNESLIKQFAPLVSRIAAKIWVKCPANIQLDDLIQIGMIGLIKAINQHQGGHGREFISYASQRIRGAIMDDMRGNDWAGRGVRKRMREIDDMTRHLEQQSGGAVRAKAVIDALEISPDEYYRVIQKSQHAAPLGFEDYLPNESAAPVRDWGVDMFANPLDILINNNLHEILSTAFEKLNARDRRVLEMYYGQDMTLQQIGVVLRLSESRVSRLRARGLGLLLAAIKGLRND